MRIVLLIFFSLLTSQSFAQVQKFTLDNGLKVVVKEDHRAPVVVSMVWYNVGSADEPGGITGVSHALEHLMFKGTSKYPVGAFSKKIAEIGGQENAVTNYDYTSYYEKTAASQLPVSFELESDRMQHLIFKEDEFKREMKVIREERRMRTDDNPQALMLERYFAAAHLSEPYHHPIIGWMNDLFHLRLQDVEAWYQSFYAPNNATLVVVGDVEPTRVRELAQLYFGNLQSRPAFVRKKQMEPPTLGVKSIQVHVPAKLPLYLMGYTVPSIKTATADWEPYALELIAGILDAGEGARLAKDLVRGTYVAATASAYYNMYTRYQTQFILMGVPAQHRNIGEIKREFLREITKLRDQLVPEAELQRIKTQIIAQKIFEKDSIYGQAMELGIVETLGLGWKVADDFTDKVKNITPEQIQTVAKRFFVEEALTEATLNPKL